ncbi:MAG: tetratricopeptide repeat protein [Candidatus Brocadiia bacterium]
MKPAHIAPICLSAVFPGCGHIAAGRPARGLLLFFLFGFAVDGFLYTQAQGILPAAERPAHVAAVRYAALAAGLVLWGYAVADTTALAVRRRRVAARSQAADSHIRESLVAQLRDDPQGALRALQTALRINDQDPDALFHLGVAYARLGQRRKARRALRRCIRYDREGKWDDEAFAHLREVEGAAPEPAKEQDLEAQA